MKLPRSLREAIEASGAGSPEKRAERVSGGDTFGGYRVSTGQGDLFLKTSGLSHSGVLHAEARGLRELATADAVRVPHVIAVGETDESAYLLTEWLELDRCNEATDEALGTRLAALHACHRDHYGFDDDNWIGMTVQPNTSETSWLTFFREHRLMHQLKLAKRSGASHSLINDGEKLADSLEALLGDHQPAASLLHGDLWGGNRAACNGEPVIFDPAVYYGDRETDIAMTQLFGGFHESFYKAYEAAAPMPDGHENRLELYRLYHILNHLNLFGSGYYAQALTSIRRLLAVI